MDQDINNRDGDGSPSALPQPDLHLQIDAVEVTHFVYWHLGFAMIPRITLKNNGSAPVRSGVVKLSFHPEFANTLSLPFDGIGVGNTLEWSNNQPRLNPEFLANRTERNNGEILASVFIEDSIILQQSVKLPVLAYNEWPGLKSQPEILAAYITPNTPCISDLLHHASVFLEEMTGSSAIDGYQSGDPKRVLKIMEAIFRSAASRNLTYMSPPASYEESGQKVRFGDQVWLGRQGACLDLALLLASALEAAGLHPVIFLETNHAYAGAWLYDQGSFEFTVEDDLQLIRKTADLQELSVLEPTVLTAGNGTFSDAESSGRERLHNEASFRVALDVFQARSRNILPLPLKIEDGRIYIAPEVKSEDSQTPAYDAAEVDNRFIQDEIDDEPLPDPEPPAARIARWQRQLLDLSLRNRLLNLSKKRTVQLTPGNLATLEDHLADSMEMRILGKNSQSPASESSNAGETLTQAELEADLENRKLRTNETKESLEQKLVKLERDARVAVDETGANTLYLALGILEWKEQPASGGKTRYAPILLMPVTLERRSVRSGFRLKRLEEETQINITLLEKLKSEFRIDIPNVDPPPEDENGVDIRRVLQRFRKAIRDSSGFEVREEAHLGLFSFTKFLLWRDLSERLKDLKRNPVVNHLVDHWGEPFPGDEEFLRPDELDNFLPPQESYNVLESDSTQLAAMANSGLGQHFVLNGPPGTGKSQTIANMIAHNLALGKSVLFVAEKRTALQVVERRLEQIGLGAFCLELHSNKTGKTAFTQQLRKAVEFTDGSFPRQWETKANRLNELRQEINDFVNTLHQPCKNGFSAYDCYSILIPIGGRPSIELDIPDPTTHSADDYRKLTELVEDLRLRLKDFPEPHNHPLAPIKAINYSLAWEQEGTENLNKLEEVARNARNDTSAVCKWLQWDLKVGQKAEVEALEKLAGLLINLPATNPAFFNANLDEPLNNKITRALQLVASAMEVESQLASFDLEALLDLNPASLKSDWDNSLAKMAIPRIFAQRRVIQTLRSAWRGEQKLHKSVCENYLIQAVNLKNLNEQIKELGESLEPLFGSTWNGGRPDIETIESAVSWQRSFQGLLPTLCGDDFSAAKKLREWIARISDQGREWLEPGQPGYLKLDQFLTSITEFNSQFDTVVSLFSLKIDDDNLTDWIGDIQQTASEILQERSNWQRWTILQRLLQQAREKGLGPLTENLFSQNISRSNLLSTFENAYAWGTLRILLDRDPVLRDFFGDAHEQTIDRFRQADRNMLELNRRYVVARVAANRPEGLHDERVLGEIANLRGEISKQRKLKPVRKLLSEVSTILPRITPCLLMSPLSVAQYLDPSHPPFDVVIFDEASQIPVCDAIGALARGRQVIVAGDPRQLPPTSFFNKLETDNDIEDDPGISLPPEQESILDECLAAQIPEHHLSWHYRSRRESLIAFSNQNYYDNRLLTFPAPESEERGVYFHHVPEGFYDRSKSRTNKGEATAVVEAIKDHFLNPETCDLSLAVITFNGEQMGLIEDLLDRARNEDTELDDALKKRTANDLDEPFKVRNLENIQGDERDIIFFSVTYGPDATGYVSHNFGPINKPGGERRLNVAITRAKQSVHLFSSMRSHQIDLRRTRATGSRHLKDYLQYAEDGTRALVQSTGNSKQPEHPAAFEQFVADSLRHRGWQVHNQLGCSGYRIDLAIVDPDSPGRYIAGVECDGKSYYQAATARDRDRLRHAFLESLGWRIIRIWSTDWFRDTSREFNQLETTLQNIRKQTQPSTKSSQQSLESNHKDAQVPHDKNPPEPAPESTPHPPYPLYHITPPPSSIPDKESFFLEASDKEVQKEVERIIETEAPLSFSLLIERIRQFWGLARRSKKLEDRLKQFIPMSIQRTRNGAETFFWRDDQYPFELNEFRGCNPEDPNRRRLEDIAPQEQAAAMAWLVQRFASVQEEELLRETATLFGWPLTQKARESLQPGLQCLLKNQFFRDENNLISKSISS